MTGTSTSASSCLNHSDSPLQQLPYCYYAKFGTSVQNRSNAFVFIPCDIPFVIKINRKFQKGHCCGLNVLMWHSQAKFIPAATTAFLEFMLCLIQCKCPALIFSCCLQQGKFYLCYCTKGSREIMPVPVQICHLHFNLSVSLCHNNIDKFVSYDSLPTTLSLLSGTASLISQWEFCFTHLQWSVWMLCLTTLFNLHTRISILVKTLATSFWMSGLFRCPHPLMGSTNMARTENELIETSLPQIPRRRKLASPRADGCPSAGHMLY